MIIDPSSQQEFSDADFAIVDNADQSKKLKFQVSGLTTATTRTWTVPDSDVTVTSFIAGLLNDADAATARATLGAVNIAGDTMTGQLVVPAVTGGTVAIADDAVGDIGHVASATSLLFIVSSTLSGPLRITGVHVRTTSSPACSYRLGDSASINFVTTNVTGTTGADGTVTVSATDAHLKIENRAGASITYRWFLIGG